ncbi:MAG: tetratricopeptide repeat protein [Deferribacteraceae bacterium]|jgi:tetratricopeptide (TPR) repeat protein|nr:tetratricopeptide repeat protein [Deferribacteraceae bacterium]
MIKFLILLLLPAVIYAQDLSSTTKIAFEHYENGNCLEALPLFESMLKDRAIKDDYSLRYSVNYYAGYCAKNLGEFDRAALYFETALRLLLDYSQRSVLYTFLGEVERERQSYTKAIEYYRKALKHIPEAGADKATLLYLLAEAERLNKNYNAAVTNCERSLEIARRLNIVKLEVVCTTSIGESYYDQKNYLLAIKNFTQSLNMAQNAQLPIDMANNHLGLALVHRDMERYELAQRNFDEALRLYMAGLNAQNVAFIAGNLIELPACTPTEAEKRLEVYQEQMGVLEGISDEETLLAMQMLLAHYQELSGGYAQVVDSYRNIIEVAVNGGYYEAAADASIALADLQCRVNYCYGATEILKTAQRYPYQRDASKYNKLIRTELQRIEKGS